MPKPLRFLILDDEPLIAMILQDWLSDLGCETAGPAHSVQDALALLEGEAIDAAILDVSLGSGTCYPVADVLRQRGLPFAFATGHGASGIDARFKDIAILSKPFDFKAVEAVVAALTSRTSG